MCKQVPKYINEICPSCHPIEYVKTFAKFVEYDSETNEYLYKCVDCGARIWGNEQWIKDSLRMVFGSLEKTDDERD